MTPRQEKLLQAIIDEFIQTAEAVGSSNLARHYRFDLSPATIRNEMADLVKMGYLAQPHSSSGRVPTILGYKEFIGHIVKRIEELDVNVGAGIREDLFQKRFDVDDLIYQALEDLSHKTNNLAFAILANRIYYSGLAEIVDCPEFSDSVRLQKVLRAVEDQDALRELLNKFTSTQDVRVLFGDDTGISYFVGTSLVYKVIKLHGDNEGFIGVIGPMRMKYGRVISMVDFIGNSINELLINW